MRTGHVTAELARAGFEVAGVDPSQEMLRIARRSHPGLEFRKADARLDGLPESSDAPVLLSGMLARFSLIHIESDLIPAVLDSWADRMPVGGIVLLAFQSIDGEEPVLPFGHAVAPAWRWHPDAMSTQLARAGFGQLWRIISRPDPVHRFPECHLVVARRPSRQRP